MLSDVQLVIDSQSKNNTKIKKSGKILKNILALQ